MLVLTIKLAGWYREDGRDHPWLAAIGLLLLAGLVDLVVILLLAAVIAIAF